MSLEIVHILNSILHDLCVYSNSKNAFFLQFSKLVSSIFHLDELMNEVESRENRVFTMTEHINKLIGKTQLSSPAPV